MPSVLKERSTLVWFSVAVAVAASLDLGSTILAFRRMGGAHGEANPVFVALGGEEGSVMTAITLVLFIKAIPSCLAILWLARVMNRIPGLYPQSGERYGIIRFANNVFYGKDVPWWTSLFGIAPLDRMCRFLSVPVTTCLLVSGVAVSVSNTFGLISSSFGLVVFWIVSGVLGFFLGIEFLRRDFSHLSKENACQRHLRQVSSEAAPSATPDDPSK